MLRQAGRLFVLLSVTAALAQTLDESLPSEFHKGYTVLGQCRRIETLGQRRETPTSIGPTPTLGEHQFFTPTRHNTEPETRDSCPNGFVCLRGRCRKVVKARCQDGYIMIRGQCRKMRVVGQRSQMLTTPGPAPTFQEATTTSSATTPGATSTLMYVPTRCRDGHVKVGGRCRRIWRTTTEPTPTLAPFFEPTTTEEPQPTIGYPRERCRDGYVYVGGLCRKLLRVRQYRSADSQPAATPEKGIEHTVSAVQASEVSLSQQKPGRKCPEGSKYKFGLCLTPVLVRLVSIPKSS